jgi:hypothetical protein
VLLEPEERRRQKLHKTQSLAPPGAKSTFAFCTEQLARTTKAPPSPEKQLNFVPTRGYQPATPSYEIFAHASLSGALYDAVIRESLDLADTALPLRRNMIRDIDQLLNKLAGFEKITPEENRRTYISQISTLINNVRNDFVRHATLEYYASLQLRRCIQDIPPPDEILSLLPRTVIPEASANLIKNLRSAARNAGTPQVPMICGIRDNWDAVIDTSTENMTYNTFTPDLPLYHAPCASFHADEPETMHRIYDRLTHNFDAEKDNAVEAEPSSTPASEVKVKLSPESARKWEKQKRLAQEEEERRQKRRRISEAREQGFKEERSTPTRPGKRAPARKATVTTESVEGIPVKKRDVGPTTGPLHPRGKSWQYTPGTDNHEQQRVRAAYKAFGISYASRIEDTVILLEKYVNHYKLGLTAEGKLYGKMA